MTAEAPGFDRDGNPYVGLRPFRREQGAYFFGRDEDASLLTAAILSHRLTVLFAPSGVGKTSLLEARVLPAIEAEGLAALRYEAWADARPTRALVAGVSAWTRPPVEPPADPPVEPGRRRRPTRLLGVLEAVQQRLDRPLVLVLDQFEEALTRQELPVLRTLLAEIGAVVHSELDVSVVLSLREEFLACLDDFNDLLPQGAASRFRLGPLRGVRARQALGEPARRAGGEVEPALQAQLLLDLTGQVGASPTGDDGGAAADEASVTLRAVDELPVDLPLLQLVLQRLWGDAVAGGHRVLTLEAYQAFRGPGQASGVEGLLDRYFDGLLASLDDGRRLAAALVLQVLAPPTGRKIALAVEHVARVTRLSPVVAADVVGHLVQAGVLRSRGTGQGALVELVHDAFTRVLGPRVQRLLEEHERHEAELVEAAGREAALRRAQGRRRRRRVVGGSIAAVFLAVVIAGGVFLQQRARREAAVQAECAITFHRLARLADLGADRAVVEIEKTLTYLRLRAAASLDGEGAALADLLTYAAAAAPLMEARYVGRDDLALYDALGEPDGGPQGASPLVVEAGVGVLRPGGGFPRWFRAYWREAAAAYSPRLGFPLPLDVILTDGPGEAAGEELRIVVGEGPPPSALPSGGGAVVPVGVPTSLDGFVAVGAGPGESPLSHLADAYRSVCQRGDGARTPPPWSCGASAPVEAGFCSERDLAALNLDWGGPDASRSWRFVPFWMTPLVRERGGVVSHPERALVDRILGELVAHRRDELLTPSALDCLMRRIEPAAPGLLRDALAGAGGVSHLHRVLRGALHQGARLTAPIWLVEASSLVDGGDDATPVLSLDGLREDFLSGKAPDQPRARGGGARNRGASGFYACDPVFGEQPGSLPDPRSLPIYVGPTLDARLREPTGRLVAAVAEAFDDARARCFASRGVELPAIALRPDPRLCGGEVRVDVWGDEIPFELGRSGGEPLTVFELASAFSEEVQRLGCAAPGRWVDEAMVDEALARLPPETAGVVRSRHGAGEIRRLLRAVLHHDGRSTLRHLDVLLSSLALWAAVEGSGVALEASGVAEAGARTWLAWVEAALRSGSTEPAAVSRRRPPASEAGFEATRAALARLSYSGDGPPPGFEPRVVAWALGQLERSLRASCALPEPGEAGRSANPDPQRTVRVEREAVLFSTEPPDPLLARLPPELLRSCRLRALAASSPGAPARAALVRSLAADWRAPVERWEPRAAFAFGVALVSAGGAPGLADPAADVLPRALAVETLRLALEAWRASPATFDVAFRRVLELASNDPAILADDLVEFLDGQARQAASPLLAEGLAGLLLQNPLLVDRVERAFHLLERRDEGARTTLYYRVRAQLDRAHLALQLAAAGRPDPLRSLDFSGTCAHLEVEREGDPNLAALAAWCVELLAYRELVLGTPDGGLGPARSRLGGHRDGSPLDFWLALGEADLGRVQTLAAAPGSPRYQRALAGLLGLGAPVADEVVPERFIWWRLIAPDVPNRPALDPTEAKELHRRLQRSAGLQDQLERERSAAMWPAFLDSMMLFGTGGGPVAALDDPERVQPWAWLGRELGSLRCEARFAEALAADLRPDNPPAARRAAFQRVLDVGCVRDVEYWLARYRLHEIPSGTP